jgi:hypothetical protein
MWGKTGDPRYISCFNPAIGMNLHPRKTHSYRSFSSYWLFEAMWILSEGHDL